MMDYNINASQDGSIQTNADMIGGKTPSLKESAESFNRFQMDINKARELKNYVENKTMNEKLYHSASTTSNKELAEQSNKAIKINQTAEGIKDYYNRNYPNELKEAGIDFSKMTNPETVRRYMDNNPSSEIYLKSYITSKSDINNPMPLYYTMGWLPTDQDEELAFNLDGTKRWVEDTIKNEMSGIDETYIGIRNFVNGIQGMWDYEAEYFGALQNYAHEVLGKDISNVSYLELYGMQEALKNSDIYDEYKPTPFKATARTTAGIADTIFTIAAAPIKLLISGVAADPAGGYVLGGLSEMLSAAGEVESGLVPPLRAFRSQLSDSDKKAWDSFLGTVSSIGLGVKFGSRAKNIDKNMYNEFIKDIGAENIIDQFNKKLQPTNLMPVKPSDVMGEEGVNFSSLPKWEDPAKAQELAMRKKTTEDMYNQAAKIGATSRVYENKKVSDALAQIGEGRLRDIKSYPELYDEIGNNVRYIGKVQDAILDTFKRTITPENDVVGGEIDYGNGIKTNETDTPVRDWIDLMRTMRKDWKGRSDISAVEQMFEKGMLNTSHLYKMKRALNAEYRKFKKGTHSPEELKSTEESVGRISEQLTQIAREMINKEPAFKELGLDNVLEYTDGLQSANLYTRDLIADIINKINKYNADIPNSDVVKKTGRLLTKLTNASINSVIGGVGDWMGGTSKLTPIERQSQLNSMLRKWDDLNKKLGKSTTTEEIERTLNEFNKNYEKEFGKQEASSEGPIEGEVFDPEAWEKRDIYDSNKYLEDIVKSETVYPESKMLNEDQQYNGNPVDYTKPTRVTPEGYAGRYGQTLESWKQWMKKGGMSDEQINKYVENLEKNNYSYKAEPLVRVIEEQKLIDSGKGSVLQSADLERLKGQIDILGGAKGELTKLKRAVKKKNANDKKSE